MKKFECKGCDNHCVVTTNSNYCSVMCHLVNEDWHEVKEETTTKSSQLPDWCKVGEWIYDRPTKDYRQIRRNDALYTTCLLDAMKDGVVVPARKREFNKKEMQGLVGKVIENCKYVLWCDGYEKESNRIVTLLKAFTAEDLMEGGYAVNRKPCYVLEHLENGGWVE
jgi:hypothetical protein